jgi:hypothetical protein
MKKFWQKIKKVNILPSLLVLLIISVISIFSLGISWLYAQSSYLGGASNNLVVQGGAVIGATSVTTGLAVPNGNVGIGTTGPGSKLVVKGAGTTSATSGLNVTNSSNTSLLYVRDDGNIGIGITNPSTKLHISGDVLSTGAHYFMDTNHRINVIFGVGLGISTYGVDNGIVLREDSGNVGIGTTNPTAKLYVNGKIGINADNINAKLSIDANNSLEYGVHSINATYGVWALGGSYGVYGKGAAYGIKGEDLTDGSYGILGNGNYGVYGIGLYGIYGKGSEYGIKGEDSTEGSYGYIGWGNYGMYAYGYSVGIYGKGNQIGVYGNGNVIDFYAGGAGTNYSPFTGGHEVELSDDFPEEIEKGMIVSVTGETKIRKTDNNDISISSVFPTVKLSNINNDKNVFGVFSAETFLDKEHWHVNDSESSDRFAIVNAIGEGRALVTNINGEIEAGDYITTSNIPGYGMKQDDDLLHSYTLGKAIENVNWDKIEETLEWNGEEYKFYLIAIVYTSG